jgi:hypothetical protein
VDTAATSASPHELVSAVLQHKEKLGWPQGAPQPEEVLGVPGAIAQTDVSGMKPLSGGSSNHGHYGRAKVAGILAPMHYNTIDILTISMTSLSNCNLDLSAFVLGSAYVCGRTASSGRFFLHVHNGDKGADRDSILEGHVYSHEANDNDNAHGFFPRHSAADTLFVIV